MSQIAGFDLTQGISDALPNFASAASSFVTGFFTQSGDAVAFAPNPENCDSYHIWMSDQPEQTAVVSYAFSEVPIIDNDDRDEEEEEICSLQ